MKGFRRFSRARSGRALGLTLGVLMSDAVRAAPAPLAPECGAPQYRERSYVTVPGARVDAAGGNLLVTRQELSIDTRLGTLEIDAVYNSASGRWRWSYELEYDGERFVDPTGFRHDVAALPAGAVLPGSRWVKLDDIRVRTKGGLEYTFDGEGSLQRIRWASSEYPRLEFHTRPAPGRSRTRELLQCTTEEACSPVVSFSYDTQGRPIAIRDRANRTASFVWDAQGRLVQARDPLDHARGWPGFRYEYDGAALTAITRSEGERIEISYLEGRVRKVRAVGAGDPVHSFAYGAPSATGPLYWTRYTDPSGHQHFYRYDEQRRLHELDNGLGERTRWSWQGRDLVRAIDAAGRVHTWSYEDGDVVRATDPSGHTVDYSYARDAVDRDHPERRPLRRVIDALGLLEERSYDAAGRLVAITNGAGETRRFGYDAGEMLASVTDAAGGVTHFANYGEHGHPVTRTRGPVAQHFAYDAVGNLIRGDARRPDSGPGLGGIVSRRFDEDRNVASVELTDLTAGATSEAASITIEHRSDRRRTAVRRPYGGDTEFLYDAIGRLAARRERVDGAWQTTLVEWDPSGRPSAFERPNGMREEWSWDAASQRTRRSLIRHGVVESSAEFVHQAGRITRLDDDSQVGPERYYRNAAGRVVLVRHPEGESTLFRYDPRGRPIEIRFWEPEAGWLRRFEFAYDGAGREVRVLDDGALVIERRFEAGRLAEIRYGNGLRRVFQYDPLSGWLVGAETSGPDGPIETTERERAVCGAFLCEISRTRTQGPGGRITTDHFVLGPASFSSSAEAGRRVTMDHRSRYWFDHANDGYYEYDVLSNLDARIQAGGYQAFVYNAERNRLQRIEATSGPGHEYRYDAAGFATERDGVPIDWDAAGRLAAIGSDTRFVWDGLGRPVSVTLGGVETRRRFGGLVVADREGAPLRIDLGELVVDLRSGERRYRHFDARGNVRFVSDASGRLSTHYSYGAYGVEEVHGDDGDPVRFAQGLQLGGLVLLGHRLYAPEAARFLAPDPIEQLINAYSYTLGNPAWFWDPGGTSSFDLVTFGMTVTTVGAGMMMMPGSQTVGGVYFFVGLTITIAGAIREMQAREAASAASDPPSEGSNGSSPAPGAPGGAGAPSGGVTGPAGPAAPSACAPTHFSDGARWLWLGCLAAQLGLGFRLLRLRRRRVRDGR